MKRFPKLLVALLLLAMVVGIFAAMPVAAASDYTAVRVKSTNITVGYYPDLSMTGDPIPNSANSNYKKEVGCLVDNDNNSGYWSTPFKFKDFKDQGGTKVPVIIFDVAAGNDGNPVTIAGYDMRLRHYFDCMPFHFELQAITDAGSNSWTKIIEKSGLTWDTITQRFEFPEVTVYKVRVLFYDIGDADISNDSGTYETLLGDETRFSLAEVDLLQKKEGDSTSGGSTTKPTTGGSQTATRPGIQRPTRPGQSATQAPTQKPTQAPTQKPTTQGATQAPTTGGNQTATQAPTQKPTTNGGQTTTVAPTVAPTVDPSVPTVDPSAPTVEPTVDPSAPTVDPSAPTEPEYLIYEVVGESVVITGCDAAVTGSVTIPETLGGYPVTAIGDSAFDGIEVTEVIFTGTEDAWKKITVGTGNDVLTSATITYQGDEVTEPTEPEATEPEATEPEATEPEATEPEATTPTTNDGGEKKPDNTWIIIVAIVAAVAVAGGAVFFIIKKKRG